MNKVSRLNQVSSFLFYLVLQVAFTHLLGPSHTTTCFIYTAFLLLFPHQQSNLTTILFTAFFVGLLMDLWSNTIGIHAFASVLMVYSRAFLLTLLLPTMKSSEVAIRPNLRNLGWGLFPFFAFLLIVIHHTTVFLVDMGNPRLLLVALPKIGLSTLLTYITVLITQIATRLVSSR